VTDSEKIEKARDALLKQAQTVLVSVTGDDGIPDMGTSPFLRDEAGHIYIYTSELSAHVKALMAGNEARFMLIADENASQNIWARLRVKFTAKREVIERGSDEFHAIADKMEPEFGPTMALIRQFSDFHMVKITPIEGVIVTGFASAFVVTGPDFAIGAQVRRT
jgi:putative heme iron utilization protein